MTQGVLLWHEENGKMCSIVVVTDKIMLGHASCKKSILVTNAMLTNLTDKQLFSK